ncbi:MAG: MerR family transcriptional regulator [Rhodococcus sp.]|nr:MerR family transcriptional regulator [Rhodococcus sp. (in: high G+C Gram-positive bacteria)]
MSNSELMPIGTFARSTGLTASALRFYADSGLLCPAEVDVVSGYRFYAVQQLERAVLLRQLREIAMPLASAKSVLDSVPDEAVRILDDHVATVLGEAEAMRQNAAVIKASLIGEHGQTVAVLSGPVFAAAIDQVLTATTREPEMAALGGMHFEVDADAVTLTATDRYRISTRTLVPADPITMTWTATVNADDLRNCLSELRRSPRVTVEAQEHGIWMRMPTRPDHYCHLVNETFPDYRSMLANLPEATTRVTVPKSPFLHALEQIVTVRVSLCVTDTALSIGDEQETGTPVPATVTGPAIDVWFEMTTLYPAISTALGPDVLLDLRAPDQPATIRSADHGDLTTLAMPTRPRTRRQENDDDHTDNR